MKLWGDKSKGFRKVNVSKRVCVCVCDGKSEWESVCAWKPHIRNDNEIISQLNVKVTH